ncbi:hypothetical protein P4388_10760 [Bacillus thuringiensis]|uniref:hypothetical protein n=1 Tax=Bacillus thuringiensis TaxID=1428 RepID=UPI000A3AB946|nr:hypothetical protein [Bacillus thuringiensis]MED3349099.1 hypothetical protein [Bacillus thuringiensis]MRB12422.1 hypothetical protein [Bacillus thuringiensis]OTW84338.1 hypothetical protein BK710_16360 [Bacillus thuringiensis serovar sumiyoshiensis]OTW95061.1 hypothetical protein BK711_21750 [Bacillus thuringiensis serovar fukuokaensis]
MLKEYTVKEVADLIDKHEELVQRWIRAGKSPNLYRNSDKEGLGILESDLFQLNNIISISKIEKENEINSRSDEILSVAEIKTTLETLLIMQQSKIPFYNWLED